MSASPQPAGSTAVQQTQAEIVEQQAETTIEVGDSGSDGYATDAESSASTSISSSVRDFAFENGRRYHKFREGTYQFPNDEPEMAREDMKHAYILSLCGGKLHYAPVENPQSIIDVGTGTGIWAIDAGDEYPSAQVLGVDLSPIQPQWVPPNVKFMVDDIESSWISKNFDLVHIRHMNSAIKDWAKLFNEAYKAMKPGGWIETQEMLWQPRCDDGTMSPDYAPDKFLQLVAKGLAVFGVDLFAREMPALLKAAGFVNVTERVFKVPIGTWPKDKTLKLIGLYARCGLYDGLQGIGMGPLTRGLKWSPEEVELLLVDVRKALLNSSTHSYFTFHVVYGQKPVEE